MSAEAKKLVRVSLPTLGRYSYVTLSATATTDVDALKQQIFKKVAKRKIAADAGSYKIVGVEFEEELSAGSLQALYESEEPSIDLALVLRRTPDEEAALQGRESRAGSVSQMRELEQHDREVAQRRKTAAVLFLDDLKGLKMLSSEERSKCVNYFRQRDVVSLYDLAHVDLAEIRALGLSEQALQRLTTKIEELPRSEAGSSDEEGGDELARADAVRAKRLSKKLSAAGRTSPQAKARSTAVLEDELDVEAFDVIKINLRGRRQERILKLSRTGIHNVRPGGVVSKTHAYSDVSSVALRDHKTVFISYFNDHVFNYESPIAQEICAMIHERVVVQRRNEHKSLLQLTDELTAIPLSQFLGLDSDSNRHARAASMSVAVEPKYNNYAPGKAPKKGNNLASLVARVAGDENNDEGKAVQRFAKKFSHLEKDPATLAGLVRQFMDSLRGYIESQHEKEIAQCCDADDENAPTLLDNGVLDMVVVPLYPRIMDALQRQTFRNDLEIHEKSVMLRRKPQSFFGIKADDESPNDWAAAVYELGFLDRMRNPNEKLQVLLRTAKNIYTQFNYVKAAQHKAERQRRLAAGENADVKPKSVFFCADDFFPVFVFVFVSAGIRRPEATKQFMWGLCDRNSLNGEGGYYLTVFEAAMEYVRGLNI